MITTTVGDLLDGTLDDLRTPDHDLYIARDAEVVFYVGKSQDVIGRLLGHCGRGTWGRGKGKSQLGMFIERNIPESRDWTIELLTTKDAHDVVQFYFPCGLTWNVGAAEQELIRHYRPCLNRCYNDEPQAIPDKYKEPYELNLEVTASDFIPIY